MNIGWFKNRYEVTFDYMNEYGAWVHTEFDNNGEGYQLQDAFELQRQILQNGHRNVVIKEMEENA